MIPRDARVTAMSALKDRPQLPLHGDRDKAQGSGRAAQGVHSLYRKKGRCTQGAGLASHRSAHSGGVSVNARRPTPAQHHMPALTPGSARTCPGQTARR